MKITDIRVVAIEVPRVPTRSTARRRSWIADTRRAFPISKYPEFSQPADPIPGMDETPLWIQITVENGNWGLGRCGFGSVARSTIEQVYRPLLTGRDCLATEFLNDLMWRTIQRLGDEGHAVIAQSAIDLALWDLKGKLLEQPVYRLLGGPCREAIPLYATTDDLDWAIELGFTAFKISNPVHAESGTAGLNQLEDKVAQARETVGPDADLMLNPVMAYDVAFAIQVAERLKPYRLRWLEEPLMPNDLRGHIELKQAVPWMPIATGEDHHGRRGFLKLIEARCVDVVQPDLCWCGGLSEALKIYTLAEAAGIPTSPHLAGSTPFGQHFALAMPQSLLAEFWLASDPGVGLDEVDRIPGTATPVDGQVVPRDAPGFGLEIRPEWITPL
ncbi:MAG: hypothetical protein CMJ59_17235 [Planctomycetaceae bacterium]|nr:hypothetical protein [Planctomycetaceae bacterium]